MSKTSSGNWVTLREKATGNHALDKDAYGPVPHLLFNLAVKYKVPDEFFLTVLFLWDKTVGQDPDREMAMGDCALSQIPVRDRDKKRWLAALLAVGFWKIGRPARSGGPNQHSASYEYLNPAAEEWESLFKVVSTARNIAGKDNITPERFGTMFARALGKLPADHKPGAPEPTAEQRAAAIKWMKARSNARSNDR